MSPKGLKSIERQPFHHKKEKPFELMYGVTNELKFDIDFNQFPGKLKTSLKLSCDNEQFKSPSIVCYT